MNGKVKHSVARTFAALGALALVGGCAQVLGLGDFDDQSAPSDGVAGAMSSAGSDSGGTASTGGASSGGQAATGGIGGGGAAYQPFSKLQDSADGTSATYGSADADVAGLMGRFAEAGPGQTVSATLEETRICVNNEQQLLGAPIATYGLALLFCNDAQACDPNSPTSPWTWDETLYDGLYFSIQPNPASTAIPAEYRVWAVTIGGDSYCAAIDATFDGVLNLSDFKTHCDHGEPITFKPAISSIRWTVRDDSAAPGGFCVDSLAMVPKGATHPGDAKSPASIGGGCAMTCRTWSSFTAAAPPEPGACVVAGFTQQAYTFDLGTYQQECGPPGERDEAICADVNQFTPCNL